MDKKTQAGLAEIAEMATSVRKTVAQAAEDQVMGVYSPERTIATLAAAVEVLASMIAVLAKVARGDH